MDEVEMMQQMKSINIKYTKMSEEEKNIQIKGDNGQGNRLMEAKKRQG